MNTGVDDMVPKRPLRGVIALLFLLLAACGQKGDLYLPDASEQSAPAVASPQDEEDEEQ